MKKFDYSKYCLDQLFKRVPEINDLNEPFKSYLKDDIESSKDNPHIAHSTYEGVLCGYYVQLIKNPTEDNKKIMNKIMCLVDDLAGHENYYVRNVIQVSFCEPLIPELNPYSDVEKYLLPKALDLAKEIAWSVFGLDHRIGWKKAKEWYFSYSKYFGMIANKPIVQDAGLQKIYDQVYAPEVSDYIPGGFPQMLKEEVLAGVKLWSLQKSEKLLLAITERIENKDNPLSDDELETAKVIMYNLRDSISLAKNYMANPIKLPHTKNPIENEKNV
jgi:hypothetical protein